MAFPVLQCNKGVCMAKRKKDIDLRQYMLEGFTIIYLILMIGIFPFYFQNNYIDIILAKKNFFQNVSLSMLAVTVLFGIPLLVQKIWRKQIQLQVSPTDVFALAFLVCVGISSCISPAGTEAFWGTEGRKLGGFILILCVSMYFVVSRYYRENSSLLWVFLLANYGVCIVVMLDFWGIDLFHMHENLAAYQHTYFIGTIGNINVNAGYLGVITSVFMGFFYICKESLSKCCFGIAVVLGIYACYCTRSDSWLLAVGVTIILIFVLSSKTRERMKKWLQIWLLFIAGSGCMTLTELFDRIRGAESIFVADLREQKLLYMLIDPKLLLVQGIVVLLLYLLIKSKYMELLERYGNKLLAGILGIGSIIALAVVIKEGDAFGHNRGYIWKRTLLNFKELPFIYKLFGYGPNCFLQFMEENYGEEMRSLYGAVFIDAHNEGLQFLAVTGIAGGVSYFGMQISLFWKCFREKENEILIVGCIGMLAYFMQGIVNNPMVFTTSLYFLFLGIMENKVRKKCE